MSVQRERDRGHGDGGEPVVHSMIVVVTDEIDDITSIVREDQIFSDEAGPSQECPSRSGMSKNSCVHANKFCERTCACRRASDAVSNLVEDAFTMNAHLHR